jgi:hypothetical protein
MDPGVNHFTADQLDRLAAWLEEPQLDDRPR